MASQNLLFILVGVVLLYLATIAYRQPRVRDRMAYWHHSVPGLDEEPDHFYAQVYQALKEGLQLRGVSLSGMGFGPSRLFENNSIFSHRPLYLCARYRHLTYYLYVSQMPAGLYISTSMYSRYIKGEGERRTPIDIALGYLAWRYFQNQTMFQHDAALMFQESVHTLVLEVLDRYIGEQNLKPLEEYERRPVYHAFYRSSLPQPPSPAYVLMGTAAAGMPGFHVAMPGTPAPFAEVRTTGFPGTPTSAPFAASPHPASSFPGNPSSSTASTGSPFMAGFGADAVPVDEDHEEPEAADVFRDEGLKDEGIREASFKEDEFPDGGFRDAIPIPPLVDRFDNSPAASSGTSGSRDSDGFHSPESAQRI